MLDKDDNLLEMLLEITNEPENASNNVEPSSDPSDDNNVVSETTETSSDDQNDTPSNDASEVDSATHAEEAQDPQPLEDRLKEFEGLLGDESQPDELDVTTPKGLMTKLEHEASYLKAELEASPLNNLPSGGVFNHNGKWVFHMTESEINDYLTELKDNGQEFSAAQVQTAIVNALSEVPKFQQRQQALQQRLVMINEQRNVVEWQDFKNEVQRKLPELTQDDFNRMGSYIDNMAAADPRYAEIIQTKEGKVLKGVEAAKKLGILQRLKTATAPQNKKPSAPDASAASKKVKSVSSSTATYTRSQLEKMSQADFNKLPDDVVDALLRGDNIIDD